FGRRGNVDMLPRIAGRRDLVAGSDGQRWRGGVIESAGLHSCPGFPINRKSRSLVSLGGSLRNARCGMRQFGVRRASSRGLLLDRKSFVLEPGTVVPYAEAALLSPDPGVRMLGLSPVIERRGWLQRRKRLSTGEL